MIPLLAIAKTEPIFALWTTPGAIFPLLVDTTHGGLFVLILKFHSRQSRNCHSWNSHFGYRQVGGTPSLEVATAGYHSIAPEISPLASNSTTIGGRTAGYQSACIRFINQSPLDIEIKQKR
jgi:hypothetical protein